MKNPLITLGLGLATTLLLTQCKQSDEAVPPTGLVPRETMVSLLIDLHLTEAQIEATRMRPDSAQVLYRQQAKQLYRRYNTTNENFEASMRYYAVHGKDLEQMYAAVVDSLNVRQGKLGNK
ncbi:DUF4296 domain-containing protein [Hymenobacter gummosus]|uniref:DUF4296 domain-containing protein n=1 Tax=Hymenobacter gummosus TaxID=1776032 RepID=A0A3S0H4L2_9BACT|nr:DUF4296 domain-containing protein [Hymenobacter gummosus]RTQ47733.1 DUF4296 domain-containing protein [Hymenobacter gummosus]